MKYVVTCLRVTERRTTEHGHWTPNKKVPQNYNCDSLEQAHTKYCALRREPSVTSVTLYVALETWVRT
jgi:hypothetical protein